MSKMVSARLQDHAFERIDHPMGNLRCAVGIVPFEALYKSRMFLLKVSKRLAV